MCLKYYNLVLLATLAIVNYGMVECTSNSIINNPNVRKNILNIIAQTQGTSLDQIQNQIIAANGNLEEAIAGINSELKQDLVQIEDDTVQLNGEVLENILKNAAQSVITSKLPQNSPLTATIKHNIEQKIEAELNGIVARSTVPVDVARQWLNNCTLNRSKRSLQAKDFDLSTIISDTVGSIIRGQFSSIILGFLENIKTLLQGFYVDTSSGDLIQDTVSSAVNWAIKGALQVIAVIEQSLTTDTTTAASRRKREVDDVVALSGEVTGEDNDDGLIDVVIRPVYIILASILSPVNVLVKNTVEVIVVVLRPIVGSIIITRVRAVIIAIVDLFIPVNIV